MSTPLILINLSNQHSCFTRLSYSNHVDQRGISLIALTQKRTAMKIENNFIDHTAGQQHLYIQIGMAADVAILN